jgi:cell division septation protein DedD
MAVFAAGAAVLAVGLVPLAPRTAVAETPTTSPGAAAAGWLARQLVDGERFEQVFGTDVFWDQGLTIDAILGFAASGASATNAGKAIDWLSTPAVADNYYGDFDDDPATAVPGSLAKLILAAEVTGKDPTNFAGVDLVALLLTLQNADTGRFVDNGQFGDSTNMFGQALAVVALARTGDHPTQTAAAAGYLNSQQCDDGGWPLSLGGPTSAPDCDSQVDATAMVVQALLVAGDTAAAGHGLDWLVSKQKPGGGFDDDSAPPFGPLPVNTNSTGLAAEALRAGGRTAPADAAVAFLRSLQVGCDGPADQRGGIAYDASGFAPETAVRATAQAVLGLGGVGLGELSIDGAQADAPVLTCATTSPSAEPTTSSPATPSPTPSATTTAAPTTTASTAAPTATTTSPTATVVAVSGSGRLPTTGSALTTIIGGGAGLVVAGAALLVITRLRRRPGDRTAG